MYRKSKNVGKKKFPFTTKTCLCCNVNLIVDKTFLHVVSLRGNKHRAMVAAILLVYERIRNCATHGMYTNNKFLKSIAKDSGNNQEYDKKKREFLFCLNIVVKIRESVCARFRVKTCENVFGNLKRQSGTLSRACISGNREVIVWKLGDLLDIILKLYD